MNEPSIDFQDIETSIADSRKGRVEAFGRQSALWLALPPMWTSELAEECRLTIDAPTDSSGEVMSTPTTESASELELEPLLQHAVNNGLAERRRELTETGADSDVFWVPTGLRNEIVALNVERDGDLPVRAAARDLAEKLRSAADRGVEVAPSVSTWIDVALGSLTPIALIDRVRESVERDDLASALDLSGATDSLPQLFGAEWAMAARRAQRLVHLGYRRRHDRGALDGFVARADQIEPLTRFLLDQPDDDPTWALHLLGVGGVGKTMLVRYIASGAFAEANRVARFPVARVDFDHVSPDYPMRLPVQLLVELIDELEPFADNDQRERALNEFTSLATSAHAAAAGSRDGLSPDDQLVALAIDAFGLFLATLPQPTVLILDTCEELAKLHPAGRDVPAVERTFAILERLHVASPSTRIVLAGRRYLARKGHEWSVKDDAATSVVSLRERDYLGLLEVRGFDAQEAREYLASSSRSAMPPDLVTAILERSREVGRATNEQVSQTASDDPRYNPFDISLYRSWWNSDDSLSAERIRGAGPDAYVEVRVVDRLRDPALVAVLPAVALLGRFDEELLAPISADLPLSVGEVAQRLAEQEWIDTDEDMLTGSQVLKIEEPLRPRLLAWAQAPERRALLDHTRQMLGDPLRDAIASRPFRNLGVHHVLGALRVSPTRRASVWDSLERRVIKEGEQDWFATVTARVAGELDEGAFDDPLLTAAVRASGVALQRIGAPLGDYEAAWAEVARLAQLPALSRPDDVEAVLRKRLLTRAALGAFASARRKLTPNELATFGATIVAAGREPLLAGAVAAAVENVLDECGPETLAELVPAIDSARDTIDASDVSSALLVAIARIAWASFGSVDIDVGAALADAASLAGAAKPSNWLDWSGHPAPVAWVFLHLVRHAHLEGRAPDDRLERLTDEARRHLESIDGERLMSACIQWKLGWAASERAEIMDLVRIDRYDARRRSSSRMHDAIPPLFVSISDAFFAIGDIDAAVGTLRRRRNEAADGRSEEATLRYADLALLRVARRARVPQLERYAHTRMSTDTDNIEEYELSWSVRVLVEGDPPPPFNERVASDPGRWHAWWICQYPTEPGAQVSVPALPWTTATAPSAADPLLIALLKHDAREAQAVATGDGVTDLSRWVARAPVADIPRDLAAARPFRANEVVALGEMVAELHIKKRSGPVQFEGGAPLDEARSLLAQAELQSLRSTDRAAPNFAAAAVLAESDPVLSFLAIVSHELCASRSGQPVDSRAIEHAYERLRGIVDNLPDWSALQDDERSIAGPWREWLIRARAATTTSRHRSQSMPSSSSPELAQSATEATQTAKRARRMSTARRAATTSTAFVVAVSVIAVAVQLLGAGRSLLWGGGAFLSLVALGVVGTTVEKLSPRVLRLLVHGRPMPVMKIVLIVTHGSSATKDRKEIVIRSEPIGKGVFAWLFAIAARTARWGKKLEHRGTLDEGANIDPPVLVLDTPELMSSDSLTRLDTYATAVVRLPVDLQQIDWETGLANLSGADAWRYLWSRSFAHLDDADGPQPPTTARVAATMNVRALSKRRRSIWTDASVALWAPASWDRLLRDVYEDRLGADTDTRPEALVVAAPTGRRAIHLLGHPVLTSQGITLSLGETAPTASSSSSGSESASASEITIGPDEVRPSTAPVVVLQALPSLEPTAQHFDSELRNARLYAFGLIAAGAHRVILVPALPVELASSVLRILNDEIVAKSRPPRAADVFRAIGRARAEIVRTGDAQDWGDAARMVARDLTLMLATEE